MKQDWEIKRLDEVCEFGNGLWTGKKPPFQNVGVIRNTNFTKDGKLDDSDIVYLDVEQSQFAKRKLQYGDIILEKSGGGPKQPVGRVIIFDKKKGDFSFSNFTSVIRIANSKIVDFTYLHRYLFFSYVSGATETMQSHSTGIRNLKFDEYKAIEIPIPPLPEQQRIVAILDEAFTKIGKAKANAEQNLKNAKELFESLLLKIFIEGINVKNWNLEKLEKYNKVVVGYVGPISKEYTNDEDGVLLLSTKNIGVKGVSLEKLTRINHQFHNKNKKSQILPGDILVARHGNSGQSAVIPNEIKMAHALNVIVIKKSETLSSEYICFLLNSGVLDKIAASKGGSVQEIINTSVIKDLIIPVPSVKEQQAIVQKLDDLSTETKKLESIYQQKINDLEELKKSVLQKAFSGELKTAKALV